MKKYDSKKFSTFELFCNKVAPHTFEKNVRKFKKAKYSNSDDSVVSYK